MQNTFFRYLFIFLSLSLLSYAQKNLNPKYTRDVGKEIVTDHRTKLMWQDNNQTTRLRKVWVSEDNYNLGQYADSSGDTAMSYCENLTLGGYEDWRLPSVKELSSIVDVHSYDSSINEVFLHKKSQAYWTATNSIDSNDSAWQVKFYSGKVEGITSKYLALYVRCVRGENEKSNFNKSSNIVKDMSSNLQWQDNALSAKMSWELAVEYCKKLRLDGFEDWRLPNRKELFSLVDYGKQKPSIQPQFKHTFFGYYWTSTTYTSHTLSKYTTLQDHSIYAWSISFLSGDVHTNKKKYTYSVRCVRAKRPL